MQQIKFWKGNLVMAVIKIKSDGRYLILNRDILENKKLSLKERGLLVTLLSLPDTWVLTINGLASILPDGKQAIRNSMDNLIKLGYVVKFQTRSSNGTFGETSIEVREIPIPPLVENRTTDNPSTKKPIPAKAAQFNNNKYTNKRLNNNISKFHNFEQRHYENMKELELQLISV